MAKWEFAAFTWGGSCIFAWPASAYDWSWLTAMYAKVKVEEPRDLSAYYAIPTLPRGVRVSGLTGGEGHVAAMMLSRMSEQGWELVQISGRLLERADVSPPGEGEAWFKRPLPE